MYPALLGRKNWNPLGSTWSTAAFPGWSLAAPWPSICGWLENAILGLVLGQMILGIILSHIGILAIAQVLHIGLSSLLVSALALWILGTFARDEDPIPG